MSKGKLVAVIMLWLVLLGIGAAAWKFVFAPAKEEAQQQEEQDRVAESERQKEELTRRSSSKSRYDHRVTFYLDSFSGYALIRSRDFKDRLAEKKIDLNLVDDEADYGRRIRAIQSGKADMAVFTIDAFLKNSAAIGERPGTIVALVDETTGADAIVAYKDVVPNIDALNSPDTRFALTPDSPSETLARVVMARFQLDQLPPSPFDSVQDAEAVFEDYRKRKESERRAYVLWEPYVSKMLENPDTHVVADSSAFPSTIVDCIVVNRKYLVKNESVVRDFIESYFRVVYKHREPAALLKLVTADAKQQGLSLTTEQAQRLVDGIWWKNTQENLAHVGLPAARRLSHVEDIIENLADVLVSTGALESDPTEGRPHELYYRGILESLKDFHPGSQTEQVRDIKLPKLSTSEWDALDPVGQVRMEDLIFARGSVRLNERSKRILDELAEQLKTTRYYLMIRGNATRRGNVELNQKLADDRAQSAAEYLRQKGVDTNRFRVLNGEITGSTSVTFTLGQAPY